MNTSNENEKHISDFMLSEYEHISTAHFESGKSITSFFRFYLLIISTPAFIFLLFDKNIEQIKKLLNGEEIGFNFFISFFFFSIALIGYFISLYIIDKKMQVILYARTVNGIRNYFKSRSEIDVNNYLVLPTAIDKPSYFNIISLFSMILPIAIINSVFILFACWIINYKCLGIILSIIFLFLHIVTYLMITLRQTNSVN